MRRTKLSFLALFFLLTLGVQVVVGSSFGYTSDLPLMRLGKATLAPLAFVQFCLRKPMRCASDNEVHQATLDDDHRKELEQVQREVNRAITPIHQSFRDLERPWKDDATAGDCNAYALAKRSRLMDMGYPSSALLLAIALVPSGEFHLVVIVVTDQGDFVLDNLQATVVRWDKLPYWWISSSTPKNPLYWQGIKSPLSV